MTDLTKSQTDPPYPSDSYLNYLRNGDVMAKNIRTRIARGFELSGDLGKSSLPDFAELVNAKFPILIWVRPGYFIVEYN